MFHKLLLPLLLLLQLACGRHSTDAQVYRTLPGTDHANEAVLELTRDGRYYFSLVLLGQTVTGRYEQHGDRLTLMPHGGLASTGTWSGDTLRVNGLALVKQP